MEQTPIYQGSSFATPRVASAANAMPTTLPFAEQWKRNREEATKALQGIEQALIDQNDNTILLSQQAEAKANDIALTAELKNRLNLQNGAPNGFYDANGKIIPSAVRELVTRYRNLTHSWNKALIDPTNQQRSSESTAAYQQGITSATEAAILANMHEREAAAYKENIRYSVELGDYDNANGLIREAYDRGVFSAPQAGMQIHALNEEALKEKFGSLQTPEDMIAFWDDGNTRAQLEQHPELYARIQEEIERRTRLSGVASSATAVRNADGSTSVQRTPALPPAGAPYYLEDHWMRFGGKFNSPEAKSGSVQVMQLWLSQNIDTLKGHPEGDAQWANGRFLANQLGLDDSEYAQLYETRSGQLTAGGFNHKPILESLSTEALLGMTTMDESWVRSNPTAKADAIRAERARIANALREQIGNRFAIWLNEGNNKNAPVRDQAAMLQTFVNQVAAERASDPRRFEGVEVSAEAVKKELENLTSGIEDVNTARAKEVDATRQRRREAQLATSLLRSTEATLPNTMPQARRLAASIANMWNRRRPISPEVQNAIRASYAPFTYELGMGRLSNNLPDTDTRNIIYLPQGTPIDTPVANVLTPDGRNGMTIEFRHADVLRPTMSMRLRRVTGAVTRDPASISWDGVKLNISNEEAMPYSRGGVPSLFPETDNNSYVSEDGLHIDLPLEEAIPASNADFFNEQIGNN
jgi:hypothetical protein